MHFLLNKRVHPPPEHGTISGQNVKYNNNFNWQYKIKDIGFYSIQKTYF